jgi:hypothetical protein
VHVVTAQHELAHDADGLVRRDAAGDADDDAEWLSHHRDAGFETPLRGSSTS